MGEQQECRCKLLCTWQQWIDANDACSPLVQIETELYRERNIRPSFNLGAGLFGGLAWSALEAYLLRGRVPITFRHRCMWVWG